MQTLNSELGALEAALGRQRDPGELVAEVAERQRQTLGFNPAAPPEPGSPMPDGDLTDIADTTTTLHATRDGRPAVVVFYRGSWCPYCNLTLRTYERDVVPVVRARGATLIAISADTPDGSLTWHELTYDVLADPNYTIARQLGIMATPPTNDAATQTWRTNHGCTPGSSLRGPRTAAPGDGSRRRCRPHPMDRRPPRPRHPNRAGSDHSSVGSDRPMTWTIRYGDLLIRPGTDREASL